MPVGTPLCTRAHHLVGQLRAQIQHEEQQGGNV